MDTAQGRYKKGIYLVSTHRRLISNRDYHSHYCGFDHPLTFFPSYTASCLLIFSRPIRKLLSISTQINPLRLTSTRSCFAGISAPDVVEGINLMRTQISFWFTPYDARPPHLLSCFVSSSPGKIFLFRRVERTPHKRMKSLTRLSEGREWVEKVVVGGNEIQLITSFDTSGSDLAWSVTPGNQQNHQLPKT